jgi:hypothetical protein
MLATAHPKRVLAVWALLAVIGAMVIVPWVMLRAFEKFEREPNDTQE